MAADFLKKLMSSLLSSLTSDHTSPSVFKDAAGGPPTAEGSIHSASIFPQRPQVTRPHHRAKGPGPGGLRESGSSEEVKPEAISESHWRPTLSCMMDTAVGADVTQAARCWRPREPVRTLPPHHPCVCLTWSYPAQPAGLGLHGKALTSGGGW